MTDPADKVPVNRHGGIVAIHSRTKEGPSSMLLADEILSNATFQQGIARQNEYPRPTCSHRAWYNVDGLPLTPMAQAENQEFSKISRYQPFKNLQARVLTNQSQGISLCNKLLGDIFSCHFCRIDLGLY